MSRRLMLLCLSLCWCLLASPVHAQDDASNPYIYYFSDTLDAFIIERADGTETRVLGDGLMTVAGAPHSTYVDGPGWSPSGKWFAWTAQFRDFGYRWSHYRPYILSADGTRRITLRNDLQNVQLAWAAGEDILFVNSHGEQHIDPYGPHSDPDDIYSIISIYFAVIDVTNETILGQYEAQIFVNYYFADIYYNARGPQMIQTIDGNHFIVSYVEYANDGSDNGSVSLVMMDTQGTVTEKRLNDVSDPFSSSVFPSVSSAGWVVYPTEDSFRAENLINGAHYTLPPLIPPEATHDERRKIFWDASGQYALITDGNLWLLDCTAGTLSQLRANWDFEFDTSFDRERVVWSPAGSRAILLGADGSFFSFDRQSGKLTELPVETGAGNFPDVVWDWVDDQRVLFYYGYQNAENGLFLYDLAAQTAQLIEVDISPAHSHPRLSPDNRLVALIREGAVIHDRETGAELEIRPDYESFDTAFGGEVEWHAGGEWLLIYEDALVAGGGYIRHQGITRADGALRRDLSFSWQPNPVTLNWLPPQVDPADLPPPVETPVIPAPQPVLTLHGSHWGFYADWSPDGKWIAAGLGLEGGGKITVWEVDSGEIVHIFQDVGEDERVAWPSGDEFVPQLTRVTVEEDDHVLACSPDGSQIIQHRDWTQTLVIAADSGRVVAELQGDWGGGFRWAGFSPDGHWLATAHPYMPVHIWDTNTWELAAVLPNPGQAVAFSPDSTRLAMTASWDVQIWDLAELLEVPAP